MEGVCLQLDETLVNLNGKYLFTMASVPACEHLRFWRSPSLQDSRQMKHMHAPTTIYSVTHNFLRILEDVMSS